MKYLLIFLALFSFNTIAEPVNINNANAKTIAESLKGVGIKKAEAIVRYRSKNGPFKSLDDLSKVKGIGEKTLKNIASDVGLSKSKKVSKSKSTKEKVKKKVKKKTKTQAKEKKSKKVDKKDKKKAKTSKPKKKKSSEKKSK